MVLHGNHKLKIAVFHHPSPSISQSQQKEYPQHYFYPASNSLMADPFLISSVSSSAANISSCINSIPMLNPTNFKSWKENILIVLGVLDLDLALRADCPPKLTLLSSSDEKFEMDKWQRSNRVSLMIMKRSIPEAMSHEEVDTAKDFLDDLEKRFVKNEKAEISTLLKKLVTMRHKGKGNIREYIMEMFCIASQLIELKFELSDDLLVHLILISLPTQFNQFKERYYCLKNVWSLNELISNCVQEEKKLQHEKIESVQLARSFKDGRNEKMKKNKEATITISQKKQQKEPNQNGCFFCGAKGHWKKQCTNYHVWFAKKAWYELRKTQ